MGEIGCNRSTFLAKCACEYRMRVMRPMCFYVETRVSWPSRLALKCGSHDLRIWNWNPILVFGLKMRSSRFGLRRNPYIWLENATLALKEGRWIVTFAFGLGTRSSHLAWKRDLCVWRGNTIFVFGLGTRPSCLTWKRDSCLKWECDLRVWLRNMILALAP